MIRLFKIKTVMCLALLAKQPNISSTQNISFSVSSEMYFTNSSSLFPTEIESDGFQWPYLAIPILLVSLILGFLIRSYHSSLTPQEKNCTVLLDIGINTYLQVNLLQYISSWIKLDPIAACFQMNYLNHIHATCIIPLILQV